jgi:hypothetical protein
MKVIEIIGGAVIVALFWAVVVEEGRAFSSSETTQEDEICLLQRQSDELTIYCVFDAKGYEEKEACYDKLHEIDKALLREGLRGNTCMSNFPHLWEERKKRQ